MGSFLFFSRLLGKNNTARLVKQLTVWSSGVDAYTELTRPNIVFNIVKDVFIVHCGVR